MIKPTIGRVVLYRPKHGDPMFSGDPEQRFGARIAFVWSDELVNLAIDLPSGQPFASTSVHLTQAPERCGQGECEWMAYQQGQAAKTEDVAANLQKQVDGLRDDFDRHANNAAAHVS